MLLWENDFTHECEKYVLAFKDCAFSKTYLIGNKYGVFVDKTNKIFFRSEGAFRGTITVIQGKIADIVFFDSAFSDRCYGASIDEIKAKFVGKQFDLPLVLTNEI